MSNTLTYCPFLCVLDANFGNECKDLHLKKCDLDMNDLLSPES